MIKVGELVTGRLGSGLKYAATNEFALIMVKEIDQNKKQFDGRIIKHLDKNIHYTSGWIFHDLDIEDFREATMSDFVVFN